MPLKSGKYQGHDPDRWRFTMMNGPTEVAFAISGAALDDIAGARPPAPFDRDEFFEKHRHAVEAVAERLFFDFNDETRPTSFSITSKDVSRFHIPKSPA